MLLIIILFLYLYNPPFLQFNVIHLLLLISIGYLIIKNEDIKETFKSSKFLIFILLIIGAIIYTVLILCVTGRLHKYQSILNYIIILENTIVILFIFCYCKNNKISFSKFLDYVIYAGLIQAILALVAFLFKDIQNYLVGIIIKGGYDEILGELTTIRMFGLSNNLTFSTPVLQGVLASFALWKLLFEKKYMNIAIAPLLIFSAIINARTSIVIIVAGIFCIILSILNKENIKKIIPTAIIIIIMIIGINTLLSNNNNKTFMWINTGISELKDFNIKHTLNLDRFWIFPEGLDLISGTGGDAYGIDINKISDVGFIYNIWNGGIILCVFIYSAIMYLFLNTRVYNKNLTRFLILLELMTFVIMNIKGSFISYNNVLNLFMLLFGIGNLYMKYEERD